MPRQIKTPGEQPVVPDPDPQPVATDTAGADPQPVAPAPVPAAQQPVVQKRPVLTPDGWVV